MKIKIIIGQLLTDRISVFLASVVFVLLVFWIDIADFALSTTHPDLLRTRATITLQLLHFSLLWVLFFISFSLHALFSIRVSLEKQKMKKHTFFEIKKYLLAQRNYSFHRKKDKYINREVNPLPYYMRHFIHEYFY